MAQNKYTFRKKDSLDSIPDPGYEKETGRGTILTIGVLLVIIVIFGTALLFVLNQKNNEAEIPLQNNTVLSNDTGSNVTEQNCTGNCLYDLAISENNYSICLSIDDPTLIQTCLEDFSSTELGACALLTSTSKLETCLTHFATETGNLSLCDVLIGDNFVDCLVAADPCYTDTDPELCRALKYDDPSRCNDDYCLFNYSITKSSSQSCEGISDSTTSAACLSITLSQDECSGLSADGSQEYCYQLYSTYTGDYSYCEDITNLESIYALECYSNYSAAESDYTLCNALTLNQRWDCYSAYSLATGDLSGCENIDPLATSHIFTCAYDYASAYGNPAACNIIEEFDSRKVCFQGPIIYYPETLDWQYCAEVSLPDWSNKCFNEAAKAQDDISLCDYIEEDYAREACQIAYEINKS